MKNKTNSDSDLTMQTTRTMRQKAEVLSRCFINMMKCFKFLAQEPGARRDHREWLPQPLFQPINCRDHVHTLLVGDGIIRCDLVSYLLERGDRGIGEGIA